MKPELKKLVEQLEKIKSIDELQAWKKDHELSKDLLKGALARSQDLLTISPKEALQLSEWALSVAFDLEDPWLEASALRAKGNALLFVDDYFLGLEYFEGALKLFTEIGDELEIARTMNSRVVTYLKLSRFDEALADAEKVTEKFRKLGDERRLAQHFVNVGHIYFRLDRFSENIDMLDRAEAILRSEEHTSELQSRPHLVCRLLLEKKNS